MNTATFDFMGAFESLVDQARQRPSRKKPATSFPEIHDVCLNKSAVIDYADQPGQEDRVNRLLDSVETLSRAYGWSVDTIYRTLDHYVR